MLIELNRSCAEISGWDATWTYDDGYFIADSEKHQKTFLLFKDFEDYVFDTFVILPAMGHPVEQMVFNGPEEIVEIINDELNSDED